MGDAIVDGLAMYAKIRAIISLIIGICIYCSCTYGSTYVYNHKYTQAQNAQITYKTSAQGNNCTVNASNASNAPGCNYYTEYNDVNNIHYVIPINPPYPNNIPPKIGSTSIYYDGIDPSKYITSIYNPLYFSLGSLCLCFCIIIAMIINTYFIFKYKNFAAINGGIAAAGSVMQPSSTVSIPNSGISGFNFNL